MKLEVVNTTTTWLRKYFGISYGKKQSEKRTNFSEVQQTVASNLQFVGSDFNVIIWAKYLWLWIAHRLIEQDKMLAVYGDTDIYIFGIYLFFFFTSHINFYCRLTMAAAKYFVCCWFFISNSSYSSSSNYHRIELEWRGLLSVCLPLKLVFVVIVVAVLLIFNTVVSTVALRTSVVLVFYFGLFFPGYSPHSTFICFVAAITLLGFPRIDMLFSTHWCEHT